MYDQIIITPEGFEIIGFDRKNLAHVGALFFLRFVGYSTIPKIREVLKKHPQDLKKIVEEVYIEKYNNLLHRPIESDDVDMCIRQNILSEHGEHTLSITLHKKNPHQAKRILYALTT
jgi:hypothetical protein